MASEPEYLTGNNEAIKKFIDKFDVGRANPSLKNPFLLARIELTQNRSSCSTAMVCIPALLGHSPSSPQAIMGERKEPKPWSKR